MLFVQRSWKSALLAVLLACASIPLAGCVAGVDEGLEGEEADDVGEAEQALIYTPNGGCPQGVKYCFYSGAWYTGHWSLPFYGPFSIPDTAQTEMANPMSLKKKDSTRRVELWSNTGFTGLCQVILPEGGAKNVPSFAFPVRSMRTLAAGVAPCQP